VNFWEAQARVIFSVIQAMVQQLIVDRLLQGNAMQFVFSLLSQEDLFNTLTRKPCWFLCLITSTGWLAQRELKA
jgi:hypothetical protein